MGKDEFLRLLAAQAEEGEAQRICGYYAEIIDDRVEAGEAEEAVIAGFGDVRELLQTMEVQRKVQAFNQKPSMSGGIRALIAVACLFASPIALPLVFALLAVVLAVYVTVFALLCSLVAVTAALVVGGAGLLILGIIFAFANLLGGMFTAGGALVCIGLGILTTWCSVKLLVLAAKLTWRLWKQILNKLMGKKGGHSHEI